MLRSDWKEILSEQQMQEEVTHPFGNEGRCTVYPESEEEIAEILRYANEKGLCVIPVGGGRKRHGGVRDKVDLQLSLSAMKGIVEHSAGDMVVTLRAGTKVREASEFLSHFGQMIPLDPPHPHRSTVGGVIAANESGPKRLRYGSARDHVLGMRVVLPNGQIIRTGGKVVKNVAGYDMNKLLIGSMGTLGIITEMTLKLRPLPKYESLILLSFSRNDIQVLQDYVRTLLDSPLEPVSLELLSPALSQKLTGMDGYTLVVAFEDVEPAVRDQEAWVLSHRPAGTERQILRQEEAAVWWGEFVSIPPQTAINDPQGADVALKIGSLNRDVPAILSFCDQHHGRALAVEAHGGGGHGITRVFLKGDEGDIAMFVQEMRAFLKQRGGYAVVQHAPLSFRRRVDVWGEKPASFPLMEGIKRAFDPHQILNPNRFVGGL
ncbi:glycolate oxidase [Collibacillus ludicampi]|uniref:Glycolate oxidase n=1 Tax=Collibacillus ludicampi TaxID=2771369 RepID=A0AAV4LJZ9_9BACL|nr:FAD-binding oxidoreductase [Collibacillus ludicampi]GIM47739.1 glycolate oxidase [Collibacillus ludicampi]